MRKYCDLHTHSYFSDGTDSPSEILNKAVAAGLSAVALTDHNTVAGLPQFVESAKGKDILAIPGVEISTGYNGKEIHIVGLFLAPQYWGEITEFLAVINQRKAESNRQLIRNLNREGYSLDYDEIIKKHQGNINRAVIAAALLEKGYIAEIKEAFQGLLSIKNGLYIPPERISFFDAIAFLKSVGAVPVLAHPFLNLQEDELISLIPQAKHCGLLAMETHYSAYSLETTDVAIRIAQTLGLLQSGGSDYHGTNKPDICIGVGKGDLWVPDTVVTQLHDCNRESL